NDVAKVEYFGPYSYYRRYAFPGIVNAIMLLANAVSECRTLTAAPRLVDALRAIAALPDNKTGDRGPIKQARHIAKCALSEVEPLPDGWRKVTSESMCKATQRSASAATAARSLAFSRLATLREAVEASKASTQPTQKPKRKEVDMTDELVEAAKNEWF